MTNLELQKTANEIRKSIVTAVHSAKPGHPGGSLSAADIFTYLYFEELNIDPKNPKMADRDRFVLSKGHRHRTLRCACRAWIFPEGGSGDAAHRILSAGTSGYEAYSGRGYVERFSGTGALGGSGNGCGRKV